MRNNEQNEHCTPTWKKYPEHRPNPGLCEVYIDGEYFLGVFHQDTQELVVKISKTKWINVLKLVEHNCEFIEFR